MCEAANDAGWMENEETEKAIDGDSAGKNRDWTGRQDWREKTRLDGKDKTGRKRRDSDGKGETRRER